MKSLRLRLRFGLALLPSLAFFLMPVVECQTATQMPEVTYSPVANPKAVVVDGHARFTVLTTQLIRMEWAADGKFEDHASFVFLNRRLPVPQFTVKRDGAHLTLDTGELQLTYDAAGDGKFA